MSATCAADTSPYRLDLDVHLQLHLRMRVPSSLMRSLGHACATPAQIKTTQLNQVRRAAPQPLRQMMAGDGAAHRPPGAMAGSCSSADQCKNPVRWKGRCMMCGAPVPHCGASPGCAAAAAGRRPPAACVRPRGMCTPLPSQPSVGTMSSVDLFSLQKIRHCEMRACFATIRNAASSMFGATGCTRMPQPDPLADLHQEKSFGLKVLAATALNGSGNVSVVA